jgi:hypothetical protein
MQSCCASAIRMDRIMRDVGIESLYFLTCDLSLWVASSMAASSVD